MTGSADTFATRQKIERAIDLYLDECYRRRTSAKVSELARFLHLSHSHLTRECVRVTGRKPSELLRMRQVEYARHLLAATPSTVEKIGEKAAFGTVNTFVRVFRLALGMTPSAYRETIKK